MAIRYPPFPFLSFEASFTADSNLSTPSGEGLNGEAAWANVVPVAPAGYYNVELSMPAAVVGAAAGKLVAGKVERA